MRQSGNLNVDWMSDEIKYSFLRNDDGTVVML